MKPESAVHRLMKLDNLHKLLKDPNQRVEISGSCFKLRDFPFFVTAAHCVADIEISNLCVVPIFKNKASEKKGPYKFKEIIINPDGSDIALLRVMNDFDEDFESWVLDDVVPYEDISYGTVVRTFGYPDVSVPQLGVRPLPRLIEGIYQRFLKFDEIPPYSYFGVELSSSIPSGVSGGPVFVQLRDENVIGVATGNITSEIVDQIVEEITDINDKKTVIIKNIVRFGVIAPITTEIKNWIEKSA